MKKLYKLLYIIPVIMLAGCMSKPMQTINTDIFETNMSLSKVEKSITTAAKDLGWMTRKVSANTIEARLLLRGHEVVVSIPYTASKYAITYKNSKNMDYDPHRGIINHNYNKWVRNLDLKIQQELNK